VAGVPLVTTMRLCAMILMSHVAVAVQTCRHNRVIGVLRRVHGMLHVVLVSRVLAMFNYVFVLHR
jgi:hypothetical protein